MLAANCPVIVHVIIKYLWLDAEKTNYMTRNSKCTEPVPDVITHFLSQLIRHFNIQNLPR